MSLYHTCVCVFLYFNLQPDFQESSFCKFRNSGKCILLPQEKSIILRSLHTLHGCYSCVLLVLLELLLLSVAGRDGVSAVFSGSYLEGPDVSVMMFNLGRLLL